jgi:hypothetical protein
MGHDRSSHPDDGVGWSVPGQPVNRVFPPSEYLVVEAREVVERFAAEAQSLPTEGTLVSMRRAIDQLEALWLAASAEFSESGELADTGHPTLASWMQQRCRLAPAEATARSKVAFAITGDQLHTGRAVKSGQVSWRQAQVIEQILRNVPRDHREEAEQSLVSHAGSLHAGQLRRVGDRLVHCFDQDRADEQAVRRMDRRGLSVAETYDGMVSVNGLLDPVSGSLLMTALDAKLRPPKRDTHGDGHGDGASDGDGVQSDADVRTWPQRRVDALAQICAEWLENVNEATVGGVRPHLSVIVERSTLSGAAGSAPAELGWVGPIATPEAQLIGCDSTVSRVVMDGPSQVIDVGRATRTIPPALRRAVIARDRTCVAPGCHRPPEHCDVHHIVFWEQGGETSLDNTVLVCRRHHRLIHLKHWQVVLDTTGRRTLQPPK